MSSLKAHAAPTLLSATKAKSIAIPKCFISSPLSSLCVTPSHEPKALQRALPVQSSPHVNSGAGRPARNWEPPSSSRRGIPQRRTEKTDAVGPACEWGTVATGCPPSKCAARKTTSSGAAHLRVLMHTDDESKAHACVDLNIQTWVAALEVTMMMITGHPFHVVHLPGTLSGVHP